MTNTILWGNKAGGSPNEVYIDIGYGDININYSNFNPSYITIKLGDWRGIDNINEDPLLDSNYHLQQCSPCIDTGINSETPFDDIDGDFRPINRSGRSIAKNDIGADEYVGVPCVFACDKLGFVTDVYISSNYAYVVIGDSLTVIDVSDHNNLVQIGSYPIIPRRSVCGGQAKKIQQYLHPIYPIYLFCLTYLLPLKFYLLKSEGQKIKGTKNILYRKSMPYKTPFVFMWYCNTAHIFNSLIVNRP